MSLFSMLLLTIGFGVPLLAVLMTLALLIAGIVMIAMGDAYISIIKKMSSTFSN